MFLRSTFIRTSLATAISTITALAWAGPTNVPIKGSITTQEVLRIDMPACPALPFLAGTTAGRGTVSHLGSVEMQASDCVTPGPASFTFGNGSLTLVAANGDSLFATYHGSLVPLPNQPVPSLMSILGSFQITGGTGRFAHASGSGYLEGSEDTRTGAGRFEINGSLSY